MARQDCRRFTRATKAPAPILKPQALCSSVHKKKLNKKARFQVPLLCSNVHENKLNNKASFEVPLLCSNVHGKKLNKKARFQVPLLCSNVHEILTWRYTFMSHFGGECSQSSPSFIHIPWLHRRHFHLNCVTLCRVIFLC